MRQAVVKLPRPKKHIREWTPLTVCGEVYKHAIYELTTDVSRLTPSDQRGWLAEFQKARKAYFYLLSDEQHEELEVLAGKWERNGVPKPLKKKYVKLVPQTRPQPHVDYQAVPEELQAYAEGTPCGRITPGKSHKKNRFWPENFRRILTFGEGF